MREMKIGRVLGEICEGALGLGLAVLLLAPTVAWADAPERPPYYAIRDARVVVGDGTVHERATVVVADGLIEAVGPGVKIPAEAWEIDGSGWTVYPGLIDAMSQVGVKQPQESSSSGSDRSGGGGSASEPAPVFGPESRPRTRPWMDAAHMLVEEPQVGPWREAGFTAALAVPGDAFFAGWAALIHFGEGDPEDRVLASGVAQRVEVENEGDFRTFPSSLMGVLSYLDQTLLDSRHAARAEALYREDPKGRERPHYDRSLDALRRALDEKTPFLLPAVTDLEIDRMLGLAKEHGLEPWIYGGHGGYARVEALAAAKASVILNLAWPEAEKGRDPEADTAFPELYHRRMALETPKRLVDAGVPFAFSSGGLSSPDKVFDGVRKAIDAGLTPEAALDALTIGAARLLGREASLGSVEVGKVANLLVANAEPWAEDVEVAAVFVDGHLYQERQAEDDSEAEPPAADVSGTWVIEMETPGGPREQTLELEMADDGKVTGDVRSGRGDSTVNKGRMSGNQLTFESTRSMRSRSFEVRYTLEIDGETLSGSAGGGPVRFPVEGKRTARAEASDQDSDEGGEDEVTVAELEAVMDRYHGPVRQLGTFAITNARVHTLTGSVLENGTVVVQDGKIQAVGQEVKIPRGAEVIDADGGSLIPGIVDAHSHISIEGGGNEGSLAVSAMVTIQDVIDPWDIAIYRALAGGVTLVNVLHGSANPIGGGNAVLKLRWGQDAAGMRVEGAPPGIKFALGENPKRSRSANRRPRRYPATRMGVMDVIRQALSEARDYAKAWQEFEEAGDSKALPPRRDLKLERLAEILSGERLVHAHCYRADEILQLLRLAEEFDFQVATLQHVLEGYRVADEIAAHGAGASTFSDWWGFKIEAFEAIPYNAALMTERGVLVSINSDSGEEMRHLNQEAAKAVKWGGMDEEAALALVTLNPAKQLGIDDRVGSIEVGKDADLVLYDGPPLSAFSVVQKTFVDGDLYFDLEADRERQAALDDIKERLMPKKEDDGAGAEEDEAEEGGSKSSPEWRHMTYSCQHEVGR